MRVFSLFLCTFLVLMFSGTMTYVYLLWNEAEAEMFRRYRPNVRHFTINRAHQPGMQRFPAVTWMRGLSGGTVVIASDAEPM